MGMSDGSILKLTLAGVCYSAICTGTGTVAGTGTGSILQLTLAGVDLPVPPTRTPTRTLTRSPTPYP